MTVWEFKPNISHYVDDEWNLVITKIEIFNKPLALWRLASLVDLSHRNTLIGESLILAEYLWLEYASTAPQVWVEQTSILIPLP